MITREASMQTVTSSDGTEIAFERSGSGPALIIVGGALADHSFYAPLADELRRHFTVYTYDRRGRGQSGDTSPYAVEREVDDLAALIDHAGAPVAVYGHSAGAALALRAAAGDLPIAKLVLADPPFTPHGEDDEAATAEFAEEAARIQELHDNGDHRGSVKLFLGGMGVPEDDVEEMLDSPAGAGMLDTGRALPYDYAVLGDGLVPTALAAKVTAPTLILAPAGMPETAQALADAIPGARFEALSGSTYETPPGELAERVAGFLKDRT
jgi:pimeloyl-ACP methyl ester carboxylesterase